MLSEVMLSRLVKLVGKNERSDNISVPAADTLATTRIRMPEKAIRTGRHRHVFWWRPQQR